MSKQITVSCVFVYRVRQKCSNWRISVLKTLPTTPVRCPYGTFVIFPTAPSHFDWPTPPVSSVCWTVTFNSSFIFDVFFQFHSPFFLLCRLSLAVRRAVTFCAETQAAVACVSLIMLVSKPFVCVSGISAWISEATSLSCAEILSSEGVVCDFQGCGVVVSVDCCRIWRDILENIWTSVSV